MEECSYDELRLVAENMYIDLNGKETFSELLNLIEEESTDFVDFNEFVELDFK